MKKPPAFRRGGLAFGGPRGGLLHLKGSFSARGRKFGIVVSQFNEFLTSQLLEGALDTLERHGARKPDGLITRVTQRLLALAAAIWFNWQTGQPSRNLTAYDH